MKQLRLGDHSARLAVSATAVRKLQILTHDSFENFGFVVCPSDGLTKFTIQYALHTNPNIFGEPHAA